MRVDAAMTRTVVTIRADATILEAIDKLVEHGISGLPVVNELGRLIGVVTEGDLLRRIELGTHRRRRAGAASCTRASSRPVNTFTIIQNAWAIS